MSFETHSLIASYSLSNISKQLAPLAAEKVMEELEMTEIEVLEVSQSQ